MLYSADIMMPALKDRNYRIYFFGQAGSWLGTWMQRVAMGWLVYRLTGSALWLGAIEFTGQLPSLIITPFAGVLSDRLPRYRIVIITQTLAMLQAFILAALTLTGRIGIWELFALAVALGLINAFDVPARHSFLADIIHDRDDMGNAIALNSSVVNGARLVGPPLAGLIIASTSEGACFLINAISYLAILVALLSMRINPTAPKAGAGGRMLRDLCDGFSYAWGHRRIRAALLLLGLGALTAMPYGVIMPVIARIQLGEGPRALGFLFGAAGCGALVGTLLLATRPRVAGIERIIAAASVLFSAGIIAFSFTRSVAVALATLFVVGFGMILQLASTNTLLQVNVDDEMRGRVMALYTMAFLGMTPFGSLIIGASTNHIGAPRTLLAGGIVCIIAAIAYAASQIKRTPWVHTATPSEIESGLGAASDMTTPPEA